MKRVLSCLFASLMMVSPAWATLMEGRYGDQPGATNAQGEVPQAKPSGAVYTADRHGRYMLNTLSGSAFFCSNQAGIAATTAGPVVNPTNLNIWNPPASGVNIVVNDIVGSETLPVVGSTATWFVVANSSAVTVSWPAGTAETQGSVFLGKSNKASGICTNTQVLPYKPVVIRQLGTVLGGGNAQSPGVVNMYDEVAGRIIIPPGSFISIQCSVAASGIWSVYWEEIPAF